MSVQFRTPNLFRIPLRLKHKLQTFISRNKSSDLEINVFFDDTEKKFLNVLLPTIEIQEIYGGLSTAIKVARQIYTEHGFDGIRLIITDTPTSPEAVENISSIFNIMFDFLKPSSLREPSLFQVCNLYLNKHRIVRVAKNDIYLATAWRTASIGRMILEKQRSKFNADLSLLYLIQDYECGFFEWGDTYLLARNTYCDSRTIALINSCLLYDFMTTRFKFEKAYVIPYSLNTTLRKRIACLDSDVSRYKENIILCYARPTTSRNCFSLIRDAISSWRKSSALQADWKVLFIGERFDNSLICDIPGTECLGKLSLEEYADLLLKSKIGISLMVSPHPSYPPLEMASFGLQVITNTYELKDLSDSHTNIHCLQEVSPKTISSLLDKLCLEKNFVLTEYIEKTCDTINVFPKDFSLT